ncbi:hypothetical protein HNQ00_003283 [Flavobacterium sp. 14A]|nr:hypothetical protein [Flavobacterium sp. 14A]
MFMTLRKKRLLLTAVWRDWGFSGISVFLITFTLSRKYSVSKVPNHAKRQDVTCYFAAESKNSVI